MYLGLALLVLTHFTQIAGSAHTDDTHKISSEEAVALVYKALEGKPSRRLPGFGLEDASMPDFPHFYFFEGIWSNPGPGSGGSGFWAVDARTGDVWEPFSCKLVRSPALKSELARMRRQKHIPSSVVRRARVDKPCL